MRPCRAPVTCLRFGGSPDAALRLCRVQQKELADEHSETCGFVHSGWLGD